MGIKKAPTGNQSALYVSKNALLAEPHVVAQRTCGSTDCGTFVDVAFILVGDMGDGGTCSSANRCAVNIRRVDVLSTAGKAKRKQRGRGHNVKFGHGKSLLKDRRGVVSRRAVGFRRRPQGRPSSQFDYCA